MTYKFALILFNINNFLLAYESVKTCESVNIKERDPKKQITRWFIICQSRDVKLEILKSQKQMEHEKVVFPDNNPLTQIFQIVVGDKHH